MNAWHRLQRDALLTLVHWIVGGRAAFDVPLQLPCVIFANHSSHLDTLMLLAALPAHQRALVRPVAGADYWDATPLRRYVAQRLLRVVLIDRVAGGAQALEPLHAALAAGDSLIVFPEGTRGTQPLPAPFKSGLYHLAQAHPGVALVPAYLENLYRSWPKGAPVPLPLMCRVHFGSAQARQPGEDKASFLARMRDAVCALAQG
ncbi:lysophospholipid acyltransferase family protein [Azohydromonas caseinilytica]|uniref:1-acyl-sn-glycerol-3-phosphate acyltransferase n=1 Tax=Azohydromonas caseinilytica TaxID=2728836 RepID=A0A848FHX5_9BURK|nr:lysophospholipid acyltransferase family protein [Azohydromonas caseinilytica]NML18465.1 1-acyl-sn-glycerol-3-phosphate acyltransferase [Azohydromonas caseinilytica]